MYYISKGIPEKNGISEALRIVTGGQVCTLFGLDEQLWLLGYRGIATVDGREQEEAVLRLQQSGLAEYTIPRSRHHRPHRGNVPQKVPPVEKPDAVLAAAWP